MAEPVTDNVVDDQIDENDDDVVEDEIKSSYKTIGERFSLYDVVLTNTIRDAAIASTMTSFNYTVEKVANGQVLLEAARQADAQNAKEYGEQYAAGEKVEKEYAEASKPYIKSLKVARIAFENDRNATKSLLLSGRRPAKIGDWLRYSEVFYRNLLNNDVYLQEMAEYGQTKAILEAEFKEVKDVIDAYAAYKKEMGEALESTKIRDEKMGLLDDWMAKFIGIARIALENKPEALKKIGL
jgi:hypothetical protein